MLRLPFRVLSVCLAAFLLAVMGLPAIAQQTQPQPVDVWLDVDTANGVGDVDDGLTMIQAFHAPQVRVRGVSVQFGNAQLGQAVKIAEHIIARFGPRDMPVHAGAASAEDFGKRTDAVEAMAAALREKPMAIAAVGPVTNVGTLIQRHPELRDRITKLIVVAARRPGQRFVVSDEQAAPFRDANFEKDVPAMRALLESGVPIVFAPWEVSSTVWLKREDLATLHDSGGAGAWIADTSEYWIDLWRDKLGVDGFTPFDTLAIGHLTHPELIEGMPVKARIEMGPDDGARPVDRKAGDPKPYLLVEEVDADETQAVYLHTPRPEFKRVLMGQLSGHDGDAYHPSGQHGSHFDHSLGDLVMRVFVNERGFVRYDALEQRVQTLAAYLDQLAAVDLDALTRDEQLALLINAYNAFTLQLMVEYPEVASIRDIPVERRWKHKRWNLGGQTVSLDDIEHGIIRPQFDEPRIHWAVVCAAYSCPPLREEAYTAERLDEQLAEQADIVHHHERYLQFDAERGVLKLTPLYNWYGSDFGEGDQKQVVLQNLARHHAGVAKALQAGKSIEIEWLP